MKTKFFLIFAVLFLIMHKSRGIEGDSQDSQIESRLFFFKHPVHQTTIQIIERFGYPAEIHSVQTNDGYILEMHRIPRKKTQETGTVSQKPPVFIQHGLLGSSADFFLISSEDALPFLLSNLGFDVWLGNVRGNTYSRNHTTLKQSDARFWNFSWHESGIYDITAQIDYILQKTGNKKLYYVGYSLGTTMFFVMASVLPEYNQKIDLAVMLGPVGYLKHIKSPIINLWSIFSKPGSVFLRIFTKGKFLVNNGMVNRFTAFICSLQLVDTIYCKNILFLLHGNNPEQFDKSLLPVLLSHYPAGYSIKAIDHYFQLMKSGKFRQFDYGEIVNKKTYGTPTPPDYNVSRITTPMYFYLGLNDYMSTSEDVLNFSKRLRSLKEVRVIPHEKFTHLDFIMSKDVKRLCYHSVIQNLLNGVKSHVSNS